MLGKTRRLAGVAAAAIAISAGIPASTAAGSAAIAPCRAVSQSTGSEVAIVLHGHYVDMKGGDVRLTCYLYQGTTRVVTETDPLIGPVAALASDERLSTVPFRVCYAVSIEPVNPWGPYEYYSNC